MSKKHPPRRPADLRAAEGLTLSVAARRIGIAPQALAKVEAGAWGVTVATLDRVAQFYGVTLTALVAGCEAERVA